MVHLPKGPTRVQGISAMTRDNFHEFHPRVLPHHLETTPELAENRPRMLLLRSTESHPPHQHTLCLNPERRTPPQVDITWRKGGPRQHQRYQTILLLEEDRRNRPVGQTQPHLFGVLDQVSIEKSTTRYVVHVCRTRGHHTDKTT